MVKQLIVLGLILLLASSAYAEDIVLPEGELTEEELNQQQQLEQAQQNLEQFSVISSQLSTMQAENLANAELVAAYIEQKMLEMQTMLVITTVLAGISMLGLWWAIFLYLQSKGLIIFPKRGKK